MDDVAVWDVMVDAANNGCVLTSEGVRLAIIAKDAELKRLRDDKRRLADTVQAQVAEMAALRSRIAVLENVAADLLEFAEEGWAYADDYFRRKWYDERIIELRAALDALEVG